MSLKKRSCADRVLSWINERLVITPFFAKRIPKHAHNPMYCLGGITFLCFLIQGLTGAFLGLYYKPTPDAATESVAYIMSEVSYGWLARSLHSHCSNAMILAAILHMVRVYFTGGYKKPRELNWIVGLGLGILTLASGFTGYLLPYDERAVAATNVGVGLMGSVPIVGPFLEELTGGGRATDTLTRFFIFHIVFLPGVMVILMGLHFYMVRKHGISGPF